MIIHEGWQAEVIRNKNNGYVLPPVVSDIAVKKFVSYMNDFDLIETQGMNAKVIAKNQYSLSVALESYQSILNHV